MSYATTATYVHVADVCDSVSPSRGTMDPVLFGAAFGIGPPRSPAAATKVGIYPSPPMSRLPRLMAPWHLRVDPSTILFSRVLIPVLPRL